FDASEDETKHRQDKLVLGAGIHRDMLSFTHDGDGNILINILDEVRNFGGLSKYVWYRGR
ncbi:hypothetical protein, partial [Vibrio lentus]|uniref:hypothetical protein n=1 Tax=Vibrio lentus TaxID=136468 RepID=UPI0038B2E2D3